MENQTELMKRQEGIEKMFAELPDWEAKYRKIISLGKELPGLAEADKIDKWLVKGCQSTVWLCAKLNDQGKVEFKADGDALIAKGLVALLLKYYSGLEPEQILKSSPDFFKSLGLSNHLTPSRSNGLFAMIKQIRLYGMAFFAMSNS